MAEDIDVARRNFLRLAAGATAEGPIVGTIVFFVLRELLADYGAWYMILIGSLAVLTMMRYPQGVWALIAERWDLHFFPVQRRIRSPSRAQPPDRADNARHHDCAGRTPPHGCGIFEIDPGQRSRKAVRIAFAADFAMTPDSAEPSATAKSWVVGIIDAVTAPSSARPDDRT